MAAENVLSWLSAALPADQQPAVEVAWFDDPALPDEALPLRGLRVTRAASAGDVLLTVPRELVWTWEVAWALPFAARLRAEWPDVAEQIVDERQLVLALSLLFERRNASSIWQPYLQSLPEGCVGSVCLFDWCVNSARARGWR